MKNKDKREFEDDGRTIVDMSGVERRNLFSFNHIPERPGADEASSERNRETWQGQELDREQRRWVILGVIRASLLIGSAFAVGIALVILAFARFAM